MYSLYYSRGEQTTAIKWWKRESFYGTDLKSIKAWTSGSVTSTYTFHTPEHSSKWHVVMPLYDNFGRSGDWADMLFNKRRSKI